VGCKQVIRESQEEYGREEKSEWGHAVHTKENRVGGGGGEAGDWWRRQLKSMLYYLQLPVVPVHSKLWVDT